MPDNGSQDELTLRRMPDGGFLVTRYGYAGSQSEMLFASTSISDALDYIRCQVQPICATRAGDQDQYDIRKDAPCVDPGFLKKIDWRDGTSPASWGR